MKIATTKNCPLAEVIKLILLINVKMPMEFILLINVKMPTFVGILTFIRRINTTSESFKARKVFKFQHFSVDEQVKFNAKKR